MVRECSGSVFSTTEPHPQSRAFLREGWRCMPLCVHTYVEARRQPHVSFLSAIYSGFSELRFLDRAWGVPDKTTLTDEQS